ncbi:MAG TPA: hypothetical protein VJ998_10045 [Pseudomonadales bacterium]|nr:hypothetical protein [Pseudomonadales bacterium]
MSLPDFLTQRGIVTVSDNLPSDHQVVAPAGLFVTLFREELLTATTRTGTAPAPTPPAPPRDEDDAALEAALATLERIARKRGQGV